MGRSDGSRRAVLKRWAVASVAVATCLATIGVSQAAAAPGDKIVVIGDSHASNQAYVGPACSHDPGSWPNRLARTSSSTLIDTSCSGTSLSGRYNVNDAARIADRRGGFTAQTKAVLIQLGFNEWNLAAFNQRCLVQGCGAGDPALRDITAANFAARVRGVVDYAKYYAPNARIALVGYAEVHRPGAQQACTGVVGGGQVARPDSSGMIEAMRRLQAAQQGAAQALGIGFVDAQAATRGHGLCTPDPWMKGLLHPTIDPVDTLMFAHPTDKGDAVLAATIRRQIGL